MYKYVAIEREYGSGGTEIGEKLAAACGIRCFGKEILERVAKKYNKPVDQIEHYEETVTGSFLYTVAILAKAQSGETDMLLTEDKIHFAEQSEIRQIAREGSAVFVGRCAVEALHDFGGILRVFIYSDIESKLKRSVEEYKIPENEALNTIKWYDKKRANYYFANTARRWDLQSNYDIILNSGKLGIDACVAAIRECFIR